MLYRSLCPAILTDMAVQGGGYNGATGSKERPQLGIRGGIEGLPVIGPCESKKKKELD